MLKSRLYDEIWDRCWSDGTDAGQNANGIQKGSWVSNRRQAVASIEVGGADAQDQPRRREDSLGVVAWVD